MGSFGIIGTGKNAANWYFNKCQEIYELKHKKSADSPVRMMNIPFDPINQILPDQMEEAGLLLLPHLHEMDNLDVSRFILANITLHEAIDLQRRNFSVNTPFISLRTVIANHWNPKIKKAMILGTYYTMQSKYLPSLFDNYKIEFIEPAQTDFNSIDQLRTTYFESPNPDAAKNLFENLKNNYPEVECFIIACTEHALALDDYEDSFNSFNLPELQCMDLMNSQKLHSII